MIHSDSTKPADLRAAIARARIPIYVLSAKVGLHPSNLSQVLNEHRPLTPDLARRLREALDTEKEQCSSAR